MTVPIHENYRDYTPPPWVRPAIERLLGSLAPEHVRGLESVVLTNASKLGKGKTHRIGGRKDPERSCRGFYHPAGAQGGAWIQLTVDNIVGRFSRRLPPFKVLYDQILSDALYHKIGHHPERHRGLSEQRRRVVSR